MFLKKFVYPTLFLLFCAHLPAQYSLADIPQSFPPAPVVEEQMPLSALEEPQNDPIINEIDTKDETAPTEFSYWRQFFKMMSILGVILGVVLSLVWLLRGYLNKRVQQINHHHLIKILEKRNLSPKSMLVLVEVGGQQILVSDSQNGGVQLISQFSTKDPLPIKEALKTQYSTSPFSFSQILQKKFKEAKMGSFLHSKNNRLED